MPLTASVTADTAGQGNHSELFVARQRFAYFSRKSGKYPQCLQHRHALLSVARSQPFRGRTAPLRSGLVRSIDRDRQIVVLCVGPAGEVPPASYLAALILLSVPIYGLLSNGEPISLSIAALLLGKL